MNSDLLIKIAEKLHITTLYGHLSHKTAFSIKDMGNALIVVDGSKIERERDFKRIYSEEIGHCLTNSFYPFKYCCEPLKKLNIEKEERRALDNSYLLQVPLAELKESIKKGSDDYEIAELLDIDIDILHSSMDYYKRKGLL